MCAYLLVNTTPIRYDGVDANNLRVLEKHEMFAKKKTKKKKIRRSLPPTTNVARIQKTAQQLKTYTFQQI